MYRDDMISNLAVLNLNEGAEEALKGLQGAFEDASEKTKKRLIDKQLEIKPWDQGKHKEIEMKFIIEPLAFQRLDNKDEYIDLKSIKKLNFIKVAALEDSEYYILIDGYRRFQLMKEKEETKIECSISGTVKCISQVSAARAKKMTSFSKPLTSVELSHGFYELANELHNEFGDSSMPFP